MGCLRLNYGRSDFALHSICSMAGSFGRLESARFLDDNTGALHGTDLKLRWAKSCDSAESLERAIAVILRNGQSTVGGPKWTKMDLFRPKRTKMGHFGPFWSREC